MEKPPDLRAIHRIDRDPDQGAVEVGGRGQPVVPVRYLAAVPGARVAWDPGTGLVTLGPVSSRVLLLEPGEDTLFVIDRDPGTGCLAVNTVSYGYRALCPRAGRAGGAGRNPGRAPGYAAHWNAAGGRLIIRRGAEAGASS